MVILFLKQFPSRSYALQLTSIHGKRLSRFQGEISMGSRAGDNLQGSHVVEFPEFPDVFTRYFSSKRFSVFAKWPCHISASLFIWGQFHFPNCFPSSLAEAPQTCPGKATCIESRHILRYNRYEILHCPENRWFPWILGEKRARFLSCKGSRSGATRFSFTSRHCNIEEAGRISPSLSRTEWEG